MNLRRLAAIMTIGAIAATGTVACSSDSKDESASKKDSSELNSDSKKNDSGADDDSVTTSTLADDEFTKAMTKAVAQIEGAKGDTCKMIEAVQLDIPEPANATQTKAAVTLWTTFLNAIASDLGKDSTEGKAILETIDKFKSLAEEKKFDPSIFTDSSLNDAMMSESYTAAMTKFQEKVTSCLGDAASSDAGANGSGDGANTSDGQ